MSTECDCALGVQVKFSDLDTLTHLNIKEEIGIFDSYQSRLLIESRMREYDNRATCITTRAKLEKEGWWCFEYCPDCGTKIDWEDL